MVPFTDTNVVVGEFGQFPSKSKPEYDEMLNGGNGAELRTFLEKEIEASVPASFSNSSWATSKTSEEDMRLEPPFHLVLSPDHQNIVHPTRTIIHVGDLYSSLLEYPPLKPVPVGKDYQAEIPEWGSLGAEQNSICSEEISEAPNLPSQSSKSEISGNSDDDSRLAGTCIIPMPDLDISEDNVEKIGAGRINCSCGDEGSIRCVQQHITEAREKLRAALGEETFFKLGFSDMGEVVSEKWSEEEELIFHEVVANSPATLGKNFWDYLATEFPSRTKNEIVSYYFNVFMLKKRALQNRCDPLNIDSDNDEWEETEYSAEYVIDTGKEGYSPGVRSPGYEDAFGHDEFHENVHKSSEDGYAKISGNDEYKHLSDNKVIVSENFCVPAFDNRNTVAAFLQSDKFNEDAHEPSKDGAPETAGQGTNQNFCENKVTSNAAEHFSAEGSDNHCSVPTLQPSVGFLSNEPAGQDVQGGVCAPDNAGMAPEVSSEKADARRHWTGSPRGKGQAFLLEPCSSCKEWEGGYLTRPKNEDFLSTCSMIEEVFGNGSLNDKNSDG